MIFVFEDEVLDIECRELRRGGNAIRLQPQVFELLAYLVRNRHRVVSKAELLHAVWGGRAVSDSAITTRINAVRRALGDDGTRQRLVRTFTGKGFRFVGAATERTSHCESVREAARDPDFRAAQSSGGPSISVLPLSNLSGDRKLDYFADGTVEDIITALSHIPWLVVITDAATTSGQPDTETAPVRECPARYLITGSLRKNGSRLRVTVRLIEAETGVQLWADNVDGAMAHAFALQDRVAACVIGQIEPVLQDLEADRALHRPATAPSAYTAHLRALAMMSSARQVPAALALLERAIECDTHYAPALALAANCCMRLSMDQISADPAADAGRGADYARRALHAAPDNPGVLANAARPLAYAGEDVKLAIALMNRALKINPNFARGWYIRGFLKYWAGDLDVAIEEVQTAQRLSPRARFGTPLTAISNALVFAERFDEAIPQLQLAIRDDPTFPPNFRLLATCYAHLGQFDRARAALARLPDTAPLVLSAVERSYRAMFRVPEHYDIAISGVRRAAGEPD